MPEKRQSPALLRPVTVEDVEDVFLFDVLLEVAFHVAKAKRDRD